MQVNDPAIRNAPKQHSVTCLLSSPYTQSVELGDMGAPTTPRVSTPHYFVRLPPSPSCQNIKLGFWLIRKWDEQTPLPPPIAYVSIRDKDIRRIRRNSRAPSSELDINARRTPRNCKCVSQHQSAQEGWIPSLLAFVYLPGYSAAQPAWQVRLTAVFSVDFP